jgi:D-tyrosyl-tRNA(Tyr) deacylase
LRAVVMRVRSASVTVAGDMVAAIGPGLLVLLGVRREDGPADARYVAEKIAQLRIFPDEEDKMQRSLKDAGGEVLLVSQFTLYGDVRRGRRPSFHRAAAGPEAELLYRHVADLLAEQGVAVALGRFGARMDVASVNDGPVTILLDSERTL